MGLKPRKEHENTRLDKNIKLEYGRGRGNFVGRGKRRDKKEQQRHFVLANANT